MFEEATQLEFLAGSNLVSLVFQVLVILVMGIYLIFAFVVIKQVNKMTETLAVGFENELKLLAIAHFILALGIFLASFVIL